ncbi:AMP-dependent synthetase/ligase [Amycolatopsis sp.]|uniref:AMP-dependent synthetase/ligase n=1 Tax=Amycolatopsis sp. TaxID=37632 RepID=UPI002E051059|nr:AMP-dependent synthetase/ligase [Amycolatopsis sp.]
MDSNPLAHLDDSSTLCAAFQATAAERPHEVALRTPGDVVRLTWAESAEEVQKLAGGLAGLGVGAGDTVALLLRNRPEFNLVDTAAIHLGAVPWSIYATSSAVQIRFVLAGARSRVVVCERDFLARVKESLDGTSVEHVVVVDELDALPAAPAGFDFAATWQAVRADWPLTIIWTSGTTGEPKPVELTHSAMCSMLRAYTTVTGLGRGGRGTSYLPAAHIADRWTAHYWWMMLGFEVTCVADGSKIMQVLPGIRPTVWGSVPRVFEKLRAALEAQGVTDPAALSAEETAAIREKLGLGEVRFLIVGAAPLPAETLQYFSDLGLPLSEVWGMSETCGLLTSNPPQDRRFGTVGPPLPGVELRIAADGEVLARGPQVMRGYRNNPELTAETLADGWLHTGDIGSLDADGYLTIVDRKKEIIINAAGKNMSPVAIENALKTAGTLIGQACVLGDRRPYNVALLIVDPEAASAWAAAHGRAGEAYASTVTDLLLREAVAQEVSVANARLSHVEQVRRWQLMDAEWLPDGDELTATMKLKRRPISEKHAATIERLYL